MSAVSVFTSLLLKPFRMFDLRIAWVGHTAPLSSEDSSLARAIPGQNGLGDLVLIPVGDQPAHPANQFEALPQAKFDTETKIFSLAPRTSEEMEQATASRGDTELDCVWHLRHASV